VNLAKDNAKLLAETFKKRVQEEEGLSLDGVELCYR
jgi:hypothetical protein